MAVCLVPVDVSVHTSAACKQSWGCETMISRAWKRFFWASSHAAARCRWRGFADGRARGCNHSFAAAYILASAW